MIDFEVTELQELVLDPEFNDHERIDWWREYLGSSEPKFRVIRSDEWNTPGNMNVSYTEIGVDRPGTFRTRYVSVESWSEKLGRWHAHHGWYRVRFKPSVINTEYKLDQQLDEAEDLL